MADQDTVLAKRLITMLEAGDAEALVELIRTIVRDEMAAQSKRMMAEVERRHSSALADPSSSAGP